MGILPHLNPSLPTYGPTSSHEARGGKLTKHNFNTAAGLFPAPPGFKDFCWNPLRPLLLFRLLFPNNHSAECGKKHIRRGGRLGHALAVSSSPPAEGIPEPVPGVGRKKDDGNLEARTSPPPDFFAFDLWAAEGQQRRRRRRRGRGGGPAQELPSVREGGRCQLYQTREMSVCI